MGHGANAAARRSGLAGAQFFQRFTEGGTVNGLAATGQGGATGGVAAESEGWRSVRLAIPPLPVLVREYVEHVSARWKPRTVKHERTVANLLGRTLPADVSPRAFEAWLMGRVNAGEIATSTANAYLQTACKLYDLAAQNYGVPNAFRAIRKFPVAEARPRVVAPLASMPEAGRRARVEWWIASACQNDVERAFLFLLYDSAMRYQEALARRPSDLDPVTGDLRIDSQRSPHADVDGVEPPKTRGSTATVRVSAEGVEWWRRAMRAPERARWGGNYRGQDKRNRLVAAFVFPFTGRQLDRLLARLRAVDPESFPRRVRGTRGGDAWHVFRHAFATDLYDAVEAQQGGAAALEACRRALRHKHSEWTQTYVDPLRRNDCRIERGALDGMRREQAAAQRAAVGVVEVGRTFPPSRPAEHTARYIADVPARNIANLPRLPEHPAPGVGSLGCQASGQVGAWGASTCNTSHENTRNDRLASPPPSQRGLPLGPIGTVRPAAAPVRRRKGGAR